MVLSVGGRRKATYLFGFGLKNDSDREALRSRTRAFRFGRRRQPLCGLRAVRLLPKIPNAIRYLADEELDWLLRTAFQEAKRRGRPMPMTVVPPTSTPAPSSVPIPKQTRPPIGRHVSNKSGLVRQR
jgi:hypothetical protein